MFNISRVRKVGSEPQTKKETQTQIIAPEQAKDELSVPSEVLTNIESIVKDSGKEESFNIDSWILESIKIKIEMTLFAPPVSENKATYHLVIKTPVSTEIMITDKDGVIMSKRPKGYHTAKQYLASLYEKHGEGNVSKNYRAYRKKDKWEKKEKLEADNRHLDVELLELDAYRIFKQHMMNKAGIKVNKYSEGLMNYAKGLKGYEADYIEKETRKVNSSFDDPIPEDQLMIIIKIATSD